MTARARFLVLSFLVLACATTRGPCEGGPWIRMRNYVHQFDEARGELNQKVFKTERGAEEWCVLRSRCCLNEASKERKGGLRVRE